MVEIIYVVLEVKGHCQIYHTAGTFICAKPIVSHIEIQENCLSINMLATLIYQCQHVSDSCQNFDLVSNITLDDDL